MTGNLFVAVELSEDERHAIAHTLSERDLSRRVPGRRVKAENWHITLCFIGGATELEEERLAERLEATLQSEPFTVKVSDIGAFPRLGKASIVYLRVVDPTDGLSVLAAMSTEAAVDVGFDPDDRPFVPHMTLSRVRPPRPVDALADVDPIGVAIRVESVTMLRTVPERGGIRYHAVHRFALAP